MNVIGKIWTDYPTEISNGSASMHAKCLPENKKATGSELLPVALENQLSYLVLYWTMHLRSNS